MDSNAVLDLNKIQFGGSLDFVKIRTPGKCELPTLSGRPVWGVSEHHKSLTIHDLLPSDIAPLVRTFPDAQILEIEVAVDLIPRREVTDPAERKKLIEDAHGFVARHLNPFDHELMADCTANTYVPEFRKLMPFNYRQPRPTEQLLYGLRHHIAQVKGYFKKLDNSHALPEARRGMRIEVALRQEACELLELRTLMDLCGYRFRRRISPFFRMAEMPVCAPPRTASRIKALIQGKRDSFRLASILDIWPKRGVQGILGANFNQDGIRFKRSVAFNQRVGKALTRLQDEFNRFDYVRRDELSALLVALEG